MTTVQGQKVKGQSHKVTHKKFTQTRALALVTLEIKRPLIVVVVLSIELECRRHDGIQRRCGLQGVIDGRQQIDDDRK